MTAHEVVSLKGLPSKLSPMETFEIFVIRFPTIHKAMSPGCSTVAQGAPPSQTTWKVFCRATGRTGTGWRVVPNLSTAIFPLDPPTDWGQKGRCESIEKGYPNGLVPSNRCEVFRRTGVAKRVHFRPHAGTVEANQGRTSETAPDLGMAGIKQALNLHVAMNPRLEDFFTDRNVWALLWVAAGACLTFVAFLVADGVLALARWWKRRKIPAYHRK